MKEIIVFFVGPTAAGKSEIAVYLARRINAEIVSCDSMQVYRGMDIITSKVRSPFRRRVSHHLLSIVSPEREYNVSRYYKEADRTVREILGRGKVPLITGGTGLYASTLLDGIFKSSASNRAIRNRLSKKAEVNSTQYNEFYYYNK